MQIVAQASQKKRLREIFSPSLPFPSRDTNTSALPPLSPHLLLLPSPIFHGQYSLSLFQWYLA